MAETFEQAAIDCYKYNQAHNMTENGVLMVTITLSEYRELVVNNAKKDQIKLDKSVWELQEEIKRLKEQILELTLSNDTED